MTLIITSQTPKKGSIGCLFEPGIGLYELFEYVNPTETIGKQFVVRSVIAEDLSEKPPTKDLISLFSSNPYGFKYILR